MTINCDIMIFNLRLDKETRRELFVPTIICGVSLYDVRRMAQANIVSSRGSRTEDLTFQIRIPVSAKFGQDRHYIPEMAYAKLSDEEALKYWTIQKGCYVLVGTYGNAANWEFDTFSFRRGYITSEELKDIQVLRAADEDFITVAEYADNTRRGSRTVQHWRIGGN